MLKKILLSVLIIVGLFLGYVSTRESKFNYERSGVINSTPEKIFPYLSNFKLGSEWSPYEKIDVNMNKKYSGIDGQVGSSMEFEGNSDVGSGKLEITKMNFNESVEIKLTMLKPFYGENFIQYKLTPEKSGTRFTWSMSGDGGFIGKLMSVLIDCDKMIGDQFSSGIKNLTDLIENSKK